jgi:serine/threonine protein kinase
MPEDLSGLSAEAWRRAQALFLEVDESGNESLLEREVDGQVAAAARLLLRMDRRAAGEGFLEKPYSLVRQVAEEFDKPVFEAGQILAERFQVVCFLGAGGMGEVYLAHYDMFGEEVALKTIRRVLADDPEIRERFLGEVQSARRVTHPNVCRIFDIFEEGSTPFYSMEYLKGETLDHYLSGKPSAIIRKAIALQLAEGLHAAHTSGIIHRDFKPQNIIMAVKSGVVPRAVITDFGLARALDLRDANHNYSLRAGTEEYLAPELRAGERASVRSDIYAYGKVLGILLPGHPLVGKCTSPIAADRPDSLDRVVATLTGTKQTRRAALASGVTALGALGVWMYRSRRTPRLPFPGRQKIVLNGFTSGGAIFHKAATVRQLFLAAIRQSPLLAIVPDERLRAALRSLNLPLELPAERKDLFAIAEREKASIVIEGVLNKTGEGLSLALRLFRASAPDPALELVSRVQRDSLLVLLAERAALDLRFDIGESAPALEASTPLEQVTSASPEAVDFYFQAVREYERSDADATLALVDRALAIDPNFALAHLQRALALGASYRTQEGFEAAQKAFLLRARVTERERNWIEWAYYNLGGDYLSCLNSIRKNTVLFPDEAAFQRQTGGAYCRIGRYDDAIPYNRRSVELDPFSGNNWDEYIANLAEGNHPDEALEIYENVRSTDNGTPVVERGAGLAYMIAGDYQRAKDCFRRLGGTAYHDRWARFLAAGPGVLQGKFAETAAILEADLAYDYATGEKLRRYRRHDYLGNIRRLMGEPVAALAQAEALCLLPPEAPCLFDIRQGALIAIAENDAKLAQEALGRLREIERRWPSTHSKGARAHIEGCLMELERDARAANLFNEARGLWPDASVLYSVALWLGRLNQWQEQWAALNELFAHQGSILKHGFPGLLVLGWLEQARCLRKLNRPLEARVLYGRVLKHWGIHARGLPLVEDIRRESQRL